MSLFVNTYQNNQAKKSITKVRKKRFVEGGSKRKEELRMGERRYLYKENEVCVHGQKENRHTGGKKRGIFPT